ncbi:MAG TPA: hypothetical protein VEB43_03600 [Anaeromyxobacter sp.]|nr:hypothetical protein [Anaeromyxobacter sp.]
MQSISRALCRLHEDASWFARAHELRLLAVRTSADLRKPAMKALAQAEYHHDNASPWVLLEDSRTAEDDGWQARANRLLEDWDRRRKAFAKEGIELPPVERGGADLAAVPSAPGRPPAPSAPATPAKGAAPAAVTATLRMRAADVLRAVARAAAPEPTPRPGAVEVFRKAGPAARVQPFLRAAAGVAAALRDPYRGLVLVLAPAAVDDARAFEAELEVLLQAPELVRCRLVLLVVDVDPPKRLLAALDGRALASECLVDPAAFERDVEALASGGARGGFAGPSGVARPRRVDDPPELPKDVLDEELRKAGIDPRYVEEAPRLRDLVLGAALAMKQGRGEDAVRMQREACAVAGAIDLHQIKVICQIALASYLSGLGRAADAVRELEDAAAYAKAHALLVQESQAHLALGMLHAVAKRPGPATQSYVQAAKVAEAAQMPLIAVEGWRLAGQLALGAKLEPQATRAFMEAIRVASNAEPHMAKRSSAPEAARTLAALCRKHKLMAQADSLEAQAKAMEAAESPPPVPARPAQRGSEP